MEYFIFNARGERIEILLKTAYLFPMLKNIIIEKNASHAGQKLFSRVCYGELFVDMKRETLYWYLDNIQDQLSEINNLIIKRNKAIESLNTDTEKENYDKSHIILRDNYSKNITQYIKYIEDNSQLIRYDGSYISMRIN